MDAYKCDMCGKLYESVSKEYPKTLPGMGSKLQAGLYVNGIQFTCRRSILQFVHYDLCPNCVRKIYDLFETEQEKRTLEVLDEDQKI